MNKKEFEEKFVIAQGQLIWEKYSIVWQWVEQYGKDQRIDELRREDLSESCRFNELQTYINNRIKELKDD